MKQITVVLVDANSNNQSNSGPRIQRVQSLLYEIAENRRCYEPMVVSIGPFHHGRHGIERMEQLKIKQEHKGLLRFGSISEPSNDVFKSMMFRDGCFILYFIYGLVENNPGKTKMKRDQEVYVMRDLFLLENQLPFIILKELMSLRFGEANLNELITKFIQNQTVIPSNLAFWEDSQPLHLLDLLQNELLHTAPTVRPPFFHISQACSPPSIAKLKASGIECKRSTIWSLKGIKFKSGYHQGKSKLLNLLVAHETCPDAPNDFTFTSYICFLSSLIDSIEDVKELMSKGILRNLLGRDQQITHMQTMIANNDNSLGTTHEFVKRPLNTSQGSNIFNNMAIGLVPNYELYGDTMWGIERHYTSITKIWMAKMRQLYAIASFAATLALLLLTMVQTYFAIFPRDNSRGSSKAT
ncbi:hypothetical protein NE237_003063 [Protea cynaroides]|uniref:Uncharacterized protein n=1 Tax=Protea cynaroides TaxID=273540 RepID=A0A9Q0KGC3_9MAGN|nr:hypothetical protein NE237_003063 [Protea cynaroides]